MDGRTAWSELDSERKLRSATGRTVDCAGQGFGSAAKDQVSHPTALGVEMSCADLQRLSD